MVSRTAGNDIYFVERFHIFFRPFEFVEHNGRIVFFQTRGDCISYGFRLFKDFLEHEMFVAAFFRSFRIPVYFKYFFRNRIAFSVRYPDAVFFNYGDFTVVHDVGTARIRNNCRDIGSDEVFAFAQTDYERIVFFRADERIRIILAHEHERIGTFDTVEHCIYRFYKIAFVNIFD